MGDELRLSDGDLGRLERGTAKAERVEQGIGRAARNAERIGVELTRRLQSGLQAVERAAEFLELSPTTQRDLSIASDTVTGALSGRDLVSPVADLANAVPGIGGALAAGVKFAGTAAGGALANRLSKQREAFKQRGALLAQIRANEQFAFMQRLGQERGALDRRQGETEAKRERERREDEARSFGGGSKAAVAALNRARRSARR